MAIHTRLLARIAVVNWKLKMVRSILGLIITMLGSNALLVARSGVR
jgi:hypothetical protein